MRCQRTFAKSIDCRLSAPGQRAGSGPIIGRRPSGHQRRRNEQGSGLLTSGIVATLILLLLLLASQTLLLLHRSTLADSVAFDAASRLATSPASPQTTDRMKERAQSMLGSLAVINVVSTEDPVIVSVSLPTPGLLKFGPRSWKTIVRTAQIRREDFRESATP